MNIQSGASPLIKMLLLMVVSLTTKLGYSSSGYPFIKLHGAYDRKISKAEMLMICSGEKIPNATYYISTDQLKRLVLGNNSGSWKLLYGYQLPKRYTVCNQMIGVEGSIKDADNGFVKPNDSFVYWCKASDSMPIIKANCANFQKVMENVVIVKKTAPVSKVVKNDVPKPIVKWEICENTHDSIQMEEADLVEGGLIVGRYSVDHRYYYKYIPADSAGWYQDAGDDWLLVECKIPQPVSHHPAPLAQNCANCGVRYLGTVNTSTLYTETIDCPQSCYTCPPQPCDNCDNQRQSSFSSNSRSTYISVGLTLGGTEISLPTRKKNWPQSGFNPSTTQQNGGNYYNTTQQNSTNNNVSTTQQRTAQNRRTIGG